MTHRFFTIVALALVVSGCLYEETSLVGSTDQTIVTQNALAFNKLTANKLTANALATHAIVVNRLPDGTLEAGNLEGLEETADGRDYLHYLAQCAFAEGDVLEIEYGGNTYEFPGLLGLATDWENGSLDAAQKKLISACLIAHVNANGVSVTVSMRMAGTLTADATERAAYPVYEGTFFGQVFESDEESKPIKTYSCQGDTYEVAAGHSTVDRPLRECTDGALYCEVLVVGRCRDVCDSYSDQYGWTGCEADGVTYDDTISVFLYANDYYNENETCGASTSCTGGSALDLDSNTAAILSCRDSINCDTTCSADTDAVCTIDGANSTGTFTATVDRGASAKIDAYGSNHAVVSCDGSGTNCEIDCKDSGDCDETVCSDGAACVLECDGASSCGFATCHGSGATSCGGGVYVCGTSCPS